MSDFTKLLRPDLSRLEEEAQRQPGLFYEYSAKAAEAKREADRLKLNIAVVEAEVAKHVHRAPEDFGLTKLTGDIVKAEVACSSLCMEARDEYAKARYTSDLLVAAVGALDQKKRMIELEVQLFGMNYFAKPSADGGGSRQGTQEAQNERVEKMHGRKARTRDRRAARVEKE